jgi:hypothetical protein
MCNAAEKIFAAALNWKSCEWSKIRADKKFFESLAAPSDERFAAGFVPTVESPVAKPDGRCACFFNP